MTRALRLAALLLPLALTACPGPAPSASCTDGAKNGDETAVDCGGSCGACANGGACTADRDCQSGHCGAEQSCVECVSATTCPGTDSECRARTCNGGVCGFSNQPQGTELGQQTAGDCKVNACDGNGAAASVNDDSDLPVDQNPCTDDVCTAGVPSNPPRATGAGCAADGGTSLKCSATATCVGCLAPADCMGTDSECGARTCTAGVCGVRFVDAGIPVATQSAGDCKRTVCDGTGATAVVNDDGDTPDDGVQCTSDLCTAGVPSNPPKPASTACTQDGGTVCNSAGACVECLTPATCPGVESECLARTCNAFKCGADFATAGTPLSNQTAGDCRRAECNGSGGISSLPLDSDLPVDGQECTQDLCTNGVPSNPPLNAGAACTQGGGKVCSGLGTCVECVDAATCTGADSFCGARTCVGFTCGRWSADAGTRLPLQIAGDCHSDVCDGDGGTLFAIDDLDVQPDGNPCTADVCSAGVPANPNSPAGTTCNQNGGAVCDGNGACVQCVLATDCPGSDTECAVRTCVNNLCGQSLTAMGTPLTAQTAGDCKTAQCDGSGGVVQAADPMDVPNDNNACTEDVCTGTTPSNPPLPATATCGPGGAYTCDGAGSCAVSSFFVLRVGDGTAGLSTAAAAGFLEERQADGTLIGAPLPLPTASSGGNAICTFAGNATSEGGLSRSGDGHWLTLGCYDAAVGTASVAGTTTPRVAARISALHSVDTTTRFGTAFSGSNIRGVTSANGGQFWAGGNAASAANGGLWYATLGASGATQVLANPSNTRVPQVISGQLYASSGSGTFVNVFTVGAGLPTTSGQTATPLPGMPTSSASPYAFALFDLNGSVAGFDTLYVADDRTLANGGGVQKWTFNGTTWSLSATLGSGSGLTTGVRGLAGYQAAGVVTLFVTSTETSANKVIRIVDSGTGTPVGTTLATAPANTVFRGVASSPF